MRPFLYRALPALLALAALAGPVAAQHAFGTGTAYDPAVPTPRSVLGYEVDDRFTPHALITRYAERVAAASRRVKVDTVGRSFEGREVLMITVTSQANLARLEQIRADGARLADPRGVSAGDLQQISARMPVVAWLGYTVHGG